jgi:peptidoglycan/xylan/chitin deacetylase (PgdA/CDA1 family)
MENKDGILTISLDFELYWGVRDKFSLEQYEERLAGVRKAVPEMLERFEARGIHATWATVGFIFYPDREEAKQNLPAVRPGYANSELSPYPYVETAEALDTRADLHFAPDLVDRIRDTPGQEVGTHTFSHYYCLEPGQDGSAFEADLEAAVRAANRHDLELRSLVFPRNQFNDAYLGLCSNSGIRCYRGNERSALYRNGYLENEPLYVRALRLLDSYINLTGDHIYDLKELKNGLPHNIPSSRFLRPYSNRLERLEPLKYKRIASGLTRAARTGRLYHLWWHPHNFGTDLGPNLASLDRILDHFDSLRSAYGMRSLNMSEVGSELDQLQ